MSKRDPLGITERIDNITLVEGIYRHALLPPPPSVKIELTSRCNYKCGFCATSQGLREKGDMDFELYMKIVSELKEIGVKELGVFYLGESFLYPRLQDAIQYARDVGIDYIFLTTNGSISTPSKMDACFRAGLNSLKFSFNYADEYQFKSIARVKPAYFHKAISHIRAARELIDRNGYDCKLYASYINYDGDQGDRMRYALKQITPFLDEPPYALPLYNQGGYVDTDGIGKSIPGNVGRDANRRDPLPCWAYFREGHITYDGLLVGCCFSHDERFTMGDLKTKSFMQCWNGKHAVETRNAHLAKDVTGTVCETCVIYE